jgi:hypothetical protein
VRTGRPAKAATVIDDRSRRRSSDGGGERAPAELPEPIREGKVTDVEAAERALVRKPKIGDTRAPFVPAIPPPGPAVASGTATGGAGDSAGDAKTATSAAAADAVVAEAVAAAAASHAGQATRISTPTSR